jgi:pimeloyl-ACP methyl ester carboxylesterase
VRTLSYLQRFGDIELAVRQHGEGMPLVWGHSLMGSMRVDDLAALFDWEQLEQHAQVVRYDARGHGNSDGSYDPEDYRWEEMAGDMLAIADSVASTFAAGRCVLAGVSMGAATALEAATQQPDKVAGMILVLPPTAWDTRPRQAAIYRRTGCPSRYAMTAAVAWHCIPPRAWPGPIRCTYRPLCEGPPSPICPTGRNWQS